MKILKRKFRINFLEVLAFYDKKDLRILGTFFAACLAFYIFTGLKGVGWGIEAYWQRNILFTPWSQIPSSAALYLLLEKGLHFFFSASTFHFTSLTSSFWAAIACTFCYLTLRVPINDRFTAIIFTVAFAVSHLTWMSAATPGPTSFQMMLGWIWFFFFFHRTLGSPEEEPTDLWILSASAWWVGGVSLFFGIILICITVWFCKSRKFKTNLWHLLLLLFFPILMYLVGKKDWIATPSFKNDLFEDFFFILLFLFYQFPLIAWVLGFGGIIHALKRMPIFAYTSWLMALAFLFDITCWKYPREYLFFYQFSLIFIIWGAIFSDKLFAIRFPTWELKFLTRCLLALGLFLLPLFIYRISPIFLNHTQNPVLTSYLEKRDLIEEVQINSKFKNRLYPGRGGDESAEEFIKAIKKIPDQNAVIFATPAEIQVILLKKASLHFSNDSSSLREFPYQDQILWKIIRSDSTASIFFTSANPPLKTILKIRKKFKMRLQGSFYKLMSFPSPKEELHFGDTYE